MRFGVFRAVRSMVPMQGRSERAVRGCLLGTVAVTLAAVSHTLAGGEPPGWLGVVVALAAAWVLGTLVAGRRPSLPRTAVIVALAQAGFHYLFAGLGGPGVDLAARHGGHGAAAVAATGAPADSGCLTDPGMALAHLIAGLVTLLLLRRAESSAWRMLRRAVARLIRPAAPARPVGPARSRIRPLSRPRVAPLSSTHPPAPRRGPPALSFA